MLTYALNRAARTSLYEQLYRALRADIESGVLAAGTRLPSKRAFAKHLGVSVVTVEGAYDQLVAEGYVRAVPRSGFYVQEIGPKATIALRSSAPEGMKPSRDSASGASGAFDGSPSGEEGEGGGVVEGSGSARAASHSWLADFTGATAPEGVFPYAAWARTLRRVLAEESERTVLEAAGPQGSPRLRTAIAAHLRGFRGMAVRPDQIVIGSGAQSLYGLLVQLLGRDLVYGVEDPGYPRLMRIYESNDVEVRPIALDGEGPALGALERASVDVLHCTPSHQFPLGTTVPVSRRRALLEWAQGRSAAPEEGLAAERVPRRAEGAFDGSLRYLIEDDFDCEFRMTGRPVPPLAALDGAGRVVYANTFSKTLGAAFRIGYAVLPEGLAERFRDRLGFYACTVGALEQLTLARFMESGDYERHVNRQRTRYRRLLSALVGALASSPAGDHLRFENVGAGLHFLMEIRGVEGDEGESATFEEHVAWRAAAQGVRLAPLDRYRFAGRKTGVPGRSANETVGYWGDAHEAKDTRREYDETWPDSREGRSRRRPAFVMSFSSLKEETIPEVVGIVSEAIMAELGAAPS